MRRLRGLTRRVDVWKQVLNWAEEDSSSSKVLGQQREWGGGDVVKAGDICDILRTIGRLPNERSVELSAVERKGLSLFTRLLHEHSVREPTLDPKEVSCILNQCGRLRYRLDGDVVRGLVDRVAPEECMRVGDITLILHSVGKMNVKLSKETQNGFLRALLQDEDGDEDEEESARRWNSGFREGGLMPMNISQVLFGLSKQTWCTIPVDKVEPLVSRLVGFGAACDAQALGNSMKALGDIKCKLPQDVFDQLKSLFLDKVRAGGTVPMEVGQFLLGVSKSGNTLDAGDVDMLVTNLVDAGSDCQAQQLANSIKALGDMRGGYKLPGPLFERMKALFLRHLSEGKVHPMDISQFFLGLSKLKIADRKGRGRKKLDEDAVEAMLACLVSSKECDAQALGNSILALSNLGCVPLPGPLFEDMKRLFMRKVGEGKAKPMEVSQFLLGASKSGNAVEAGSLDTLARCLVAWGHQGHCNAQVLANSIKALGAMEHTLPDKVVDDLAGLFVKRKQRGEALPIHVNQFEWGCDKIRRRRGRTT